jgi:hypothetical protein
MIDYTKTQTAVVREYTITVSLPELKVLQRARQLVNGGADMIILEVDNGKLKIRPVGKKEG